MSLATASEKKRKLNARKVTYKFGGKKMNVIRSTEEYPTETEMNTLPHNKLELAYVHGYNGFNFNSRDNVVVSNCGNYLIYHIAATCVVYDIKKKSQRFFTAHNDDITALCIDQRNNSTLVASGQTQPIERPHEKRDLPKLWVWDLKDMSKVELIDKICWNYVCRVKWSPVSGLIYVLAGDDNHTLKGFDPNDFNQNWKKVEKREADPKVKPTEECNKKRVVECETMKEAISGMLINPRNQLSSDEKKREEVWTDNDETYDAERIIDEILVYGKRKFIFIELKQQAKTVANRNLQLNEVVKSVVITKLNKDGEKAFTAAEFLDNGFYAVGCASGNVYINKGAEAMCLIKSCHSKPIGVLHWTGKRLFSGGFDKMFRTWSMNEEEFKSGGKAMSKLSERYIDVAGTDMVFQPKALAYAKKLKKIYIGVKSNQIVEINEAANVSESGISLVIDGHDGEVNYLDTHPELNLFITCGNDQSVKLWNADKLKCIQTHEFLSNASKKSDKEEEKQNTSHTRSRSVSRGSLKTGKEIVCCTFSNDGNMIAFATEDSRVCIVSFEAFLIEKERYMQCTMYQIATKARASKQIISDIKFSPDDKVLAVAHAAEQKIYLFGVTRLKMNQIKLDYWSPIPQHHAPYQIQWSIDGTLLKTLTKGMEVIHWSIDANGKKFKAHPEIPDPDDKAVLWFGNPLSAGWDTQALYQNNLKWETYCLGNAALYAKRLAINAKTKSSQVISGDQFGQIRIFNYPAVNEDAGICHYAHSENVVALNLLKNSNVLCSAGGMDMSIMQWNVVANKGNKELKVSEEKKEEKKDEEKNEEEKKEDKKKEVKKADKKPAEKKGAEKKAAEKKGAKKDEKKSAAKKDEKKGGKKK